MRVCFGVRMILFLTEELGCDIGFSHKNCWKLLDSVFEWPYIEGAKQVLTNFNRPFHTEYLVIKKVEYFFKNSITKIQWRFSLITLVLNILSNCHVYKIWQKKRVVQQVLRCYVIKYRCHNLKFSCLYFVTLWGNLTI